MNDNGKDKQTYEEGTDKGVVREKPGLIDEEDLTRLSRTEVRKGSILGNERVRIVLPSQRAFRRIGTGMLEATELTQAPRAGMGRVIFNVKRFLIGAPLTTA